MLSLKNICHFLFVSIFAGKLFCLDNSNSQLNYHPTKEQVFLFIRNGDLTALQKLLEPIEEDNKKILLKGALVEAAKYSYLHIISYLLSTESCDPNETDRYGNTFAHIAILRKMPQLLPIFKKININYNATNEIGLNIFDYARIMGNYHYISFIYQNGGRSSFNDIFLPIMIAAANCNLPSVKIYYKNKPSRLPMNVANFVFCFLATKKNTGTLYHFMKNEDIDPNIIYYFSNAKDIVNENIDPNIIYYISKVIDITEYISSSYLYNNSQLQKRKAGQTLYSLPTKYSRIDSDTEDNFQPVFNEAENFYSDEFHIYN